MSFEDELKELIANALAETERKNQELLDFRNHWQRVKVDTVKPVLDQGVQALRIYARMEAATELKNGSIRLSVGRSSHNSFTVINELAFSPDEGKLEIQCSYRGATPEAFTVDSLDQSTVENKVKEFVSTVLT